jgi:hypothetical protein
MVFLSYVLAAEPENQTIHTALVMEGVGVGMTGLAFMAFSSGSNKQKNLLERGQAL